VFTLWLDLALMDFICSCQKYNNKISCACDICMYSLYLRPKTLIIIVVLTHKQTFTIYFSSFKHAVASPTQTKRNLFWNNSGIVIVFVHTSTNLISLHHYWYLWGWEEEFEDTKGIIIVRKWKKDNTMAKIKSTQGQTTIYKTQHRKLKIVQQEHHWNQGVWVLSCFKRFQFLHNFQQYLLIA
jgi:hypothetical protein